MKTKSAMITIAGRPNVGKSTLTNYLVGEKIAIVSNKPQTTRNRICGIVTRGDTQFVFVDTPGYHRARTKLGDYMVNVARESISDVDLAILVVEPIASIGPQEEGLIDKIKSSHCPAILAINKIDTVEKDALLEVIAVYSQAAAFDAIIPISAKTGDGVEDLLETCGKYAEESPFLFPEDVTTDQPERQIAAEIIREKGTNRSKFLRGQIDKYTWVDYGSSYLPSDLNAAYLLPQLEDADKINEDRLHSWNRYYKGLEPLQKAGKIELPVIPEGCVHNSHMFYIKCADLEERTALIAFLKERGITSSFHYIPLHSAPAGQRFGYFGGEDVYTTKESNRLTRLPMYYGLTDEDGEAVINAIYEFYGESR